MIVEKDVKQGTRKVSNEEVLKAAMEISKQYKDALDRLAKN